MPESVQPEPTPKSIMVVTDTPEDLEVIRRHLGGAGYELIQVWDVAGALERARAKAPDLILLDIATPGMEGLEFCRELRADVGTEAIPVIAITDDATAESETVLAVGADGCVSRPFHRAELLSRVRTLLRLKELNDRISDQHRQVLEANARLDALNQEVMARNRELEQGMEMAHRLQEALLPQQYPRVKNISFSHKYEPAEAIGGDTFQITGTADGQAAVFIADVSGHGVRAALVASIVRTVIDYIDLGGKSPSDVLADFNSRFRSVLGPMTPQIYATAVLMLIDGEGRSVRIANAGHPIPLLVTKARMAAEPIVTPDDCGPALGFVPDPHFPMAELKLSVGDIILAFTDGAYEVLSEAGEMYGLARMQALVADNTHLVPRDLIERILRETGAFMGMGRRPDDVCLVAVEVH
jgi:sigma-B regulation protein RsbU (phosphoserine phosphatase)